MKVSCLQENLARGLGIVGRAVSTRSTLPVLANVLLKVDDGRLMLSATNLEIVITCWIGAKVVETGAVTVPARTFVDLVSSLPPEPVDLQLDEATQTLHITCARTEANVKGIAAEEFPIIPQPGEKNRIALKTATLKEMIKHVSFAAADNDTRPILTGVHTYFEGKTVGMAATDGFRLSVMKAELPRPVDEPISVVIPARALTELARIAGDEPDTVYITFPDGRKQIIFDLESIVLVSQLIQGNFPEYGPIIPTKANTKTVINTAEFLKACRTADIFAREASHAARVQIEPGDEITPGHAIISATSNETGDNVAQIDAEVDGESVEVTFNVKFMTQVLSVLDSPQVLLETKSAKEPGLLRPVSDVDFVHVIMPMHFGR